MHANSANCIVDLSLPSPSIPFFFHAVPHLICVFRCRLTITLRTKAQLPWYNTTALKGAEFEMGSSVNAPIVKAASCQAKHGTRKVQFPITSAQATVQYDSITFQLPLTLLGSSLTGTVLCYQIVNAL